MASLSKQKHLIIIPFLIISSIGKGQCIPDNFCKESIERLTRAKFNFLKSFKMNGEDGSLEKIEYSYVLTKGSKYMISISASGQHPERILFTLCNRDRVKVVTNAIDGKRLSDFVFECNSTGIYYFQYSFSEAGINCGGSAIGFTR